MPHRAWRYRTWQTAAGQPGAKGAGEISEALALAELKDRNWSIVGCSAIDGRGVSEGMDWLVVSFLSFG